MKQINKSRFDISRKEYIFYSDHIIKVQFLTFKDNEKGMIVFDITGMQSFVIKKGSEDQYKETKRKIKHEEKYILEINSEYWNELISK